MIPKKGKRGKRVQELSAQNGGNPLNSVHAALFGGALMRAVLREGMLRPAKAGHATQGEARRRGDTKDEGDEATAYLTFSDRELLI